ncbi:MAG: RNA polymerase sigma factor [Ilumatobacteraceae bacterium]
MHDEKELIARARKGDRAATDRLLRLHYDTVHAVCRRIVIDRHAAEDATQAAMIAVVRALPGFDGRAKFTTWLYRIATNAAIDEVRRIRRRPVPVDHSAVTVAQPGDRTEWVAERLAFESALGSVTEEYRPALVLRHVAELDYAEIAEVLGLPVGTVRSRLARGRSQLMEALGNPDGTAGRQNPTEDPGLPGSVPRPEGGTR